MTNVEKPSEIPINDYRKRIFCRKKYSGGLKLDFLIEGLSVHSRVQPPMHSCCYGNIVKTTLITPVINEIMNIAGNHFFECPYKITNIEFNFIKPLYVENIIRAEGKVLKQKGIGDSSIEAFLFNETDDLCVTSTAVLMFNPLC